MAQYFVNKIMPTIDHADQLNCMLSSMTLVYQRIKHLNFNKPNRKMYKSDVMID
jgi:hypothetical protein